MTGDTGTGTFTGMKNSPEPGEDRLRYLASLIDNVSDAIFSFDRQRKITFWNKRAQEVYGWTSEEAVGRNAAVLLKVEIDESERNKWLLNAEKHGELLIEAVHYTKFNEKIVVESHLLPVKDQFGEVTGYTTVNRDVTERKKAEEALEDAKNRYLSLFNNRTNAIAHCRTITDEQGKPVDYEIIQINDAYTFITGIKKENIEGRHATEVFPGIENFSFDYIGNLGHVALGGGELNTEVFFEALGQWLSVYAYCPKAGEFTVIFTDITQRKNAEEASRQSEMRFRSTLDFLTEGCAILDFNWNYLYVNDVNASHAHRSKDEMIGKNMFELIPGVEKSVFFEAYRRCMENRTREQVEAAFTFEDGSVSWYEAKAEPVPEGIFVLSADITERKKAEERLKKSEENFRTLADNISQLAWMTDEMGGILWYNKRWYDYTGTSLEEMQGWGWQKVHNPDHLDRVMKNWTKALSNGEAWEDTFPLRGKDGQYRWFLSRALPINDENGKVVRWFGTNTDITERKEMEEKLKLSQSRLNDAQKLAHVGSFSIDIATGKIEASEEAYNICELDPAEGKLTLDFITSCWYPEDKPWVIEAIKEGMSNNKLINFESRMLFPSGKVKYVSYIARPLNDAIGKPIKRVGAVTDITERKLQELELRRTLEELKRSNEELEQFAYVASHDLQEPLRMVSAYTKLLEMQLKDKLDEKTAKYMYFVIDGAKRMHALIQDLLAFSRVTSPRETISRTDLNDLMAEIMRDFQVAITDHSAQVEIAEMPVLYLDPTQVKLVFQNLIQNAIKFKGAENPFIQIKAEKKEHEWLFSVKDNGIGIDPEFHERIFVIFQRLHEKEKYPGTGIGLSICKKIVERHGGRIWLDSKPGEGSTFFFTIPDGESEKQQEVRSSRK
ncbi:MAG TPA: PAS domain S-box protein [Ignavibacteriales bacterium]|nr:PAS domain S-box protein [Ignavibacteriales bacterium]